MPLAISCSTCFAEFESWAALSTHRASHYGNTGAHEPLMERARADRALRISLANERMRAYVPDPRPYVSQPMTYVHAQESAEHRAWEREKNELREANNARRRSIPLTQWLSPMELAFDDRMLKTNVFTEGRVVQSTERMSELPEVAYYGPYEQLTGAMRVSNDEKIHCHRRECEDRWNAGYQVCPHIWTPESAASIAATPSPE